LTIRKKPDGSEQMTVLSKEAARRARPVAVFLTALAVVALSSAVAPVGADTSKTGHKAIEGLARVGASFYDAKITTSDLDGDGRMEILVGNTNGNVYCFTSKAKLKWSHNTGAMIQGAPACKDVNGDGNKEVFVGDMNGVVWGFGSDGTVLTHWGWPKATQCSPGGGVNGVYSSPAIGDINGDGIDDVVVGTWGKYIYAWSYTGGLLPGWPYDNKDSVWSSPALADIDMDGVKEVIIGADSTGGSDWPYPAGGLLYAFNGDGSTCAGFPLWTPEVIWSSPAVADIDGDGYYEIVVGTGHYYKAIGRLSTEGHRVYAFNHDGSMVGGWPVTAAGSTFSSPAVGDIDRDGTMEVVIACNGMNGIGEDRVMAIKPDGSVMWEVRAFGGPNLGSPAIGDVNGDGFPDVVLGSGWAIGAWDHTGKVIWDQPLDNFVITSPAVGDFDADGHVKVACATGDAPGGNHPGGSFLVFDCGRKRNVKGGDAALFPWAMFRYRGHHNATILTGNEPPPPPPPPPPANFHEYILMMNPGEAVANATIELMNEAGEKMSIPWRILPGSRSTAHVNRLMPGCGVSARVISDTPIICERSMYFDYQGRWQGGTDSAGATEPSDTWYLAEGYTAPNFEEFVLIQNPQKKWVKAELTFMREGTEPIQASVNLAPESRFTLNVKVVPGLENASVSTMVRAADGVVCERSMYFDYGGHTGGHNAMGVTEPAEKWYLAEGYTAQEYDTYVLIQNPGDSQARVDLSFLRSDGHVREMPVTVPATGRRTVKVDDVPGFEAAEVSTQITSDVPVIAERAMYFDAGGRSGGHDSTGVSRPAETWYLAEGYTGGEFDSYVLLMNPGGAARVRTTFMRSDGHSWSRTDDLLPRSRFTIHIDEMPGFENAEVSTLVETVDGSRIIAERAVYFVYDGVYPGGHGCVGVNSPEKTWYFAEGYTGM
jgi:hypothetical protein